MTPSHARSARFDPRTVTYAALYLAIAMVLPFITGQVPQIGKMLSPMHIPVLLCGFMCGWKWGLAVGLVAPVLRSALFGMPEMFPTAVAMTFELAVYGSMTGLLFRLFPKKAWTLYPALILSMAAGRLVYGAVQFILAGVAKTDFTWKAYLTGTIVKTIPGIVLHVAIVPPIVMLMNRIGLSPAAAKNTSR